jgi:hypothetical protein
VLIFAVLVGKIRLLVFRCLRSLDGLNFQKELYMWVDFVMEET